MKISKTFGKVFRSVLLVFGIIALLGFYITTVSDLPARVYTETQREFLAYNQMRSIQQIAPTLEFKLGRDSAVSEGEVLAFQLPWKKSRVHAKLKARFEEESGVSVAVYDLEFVGEYALSHTDDVDAIVNLFFPFPSNLETYHNVSFLVDGEEPDDAVYSTAGISWQTYMEPGDNYDVVISYQAEGANSFSYGLVHNQRTDIDITVEVDGLNGAEIAKATLPESSMENSEKNESWVWHYDGLIADRDIRLNLPKKLNFAQRVAEKQSDFRALSQAAPFLVGLFLATLAMIFRAQKTRLKLESYLLMGLGIAIFFPLLTFLSAAVPQIIAIVFAFVIVVGLLLLFVNRAIGERAAVIRTGLLLAVFLGLFAVGIISPWRGLFFTLGGLILVGTFMAIYARQAVMETSPTPELEPIDEGEIHTEETTVEVTADRDKRIPKSLMTAVPDKIFATEPKAIQAHCPFCGRVLDEDFDFCPGCGKETGEVQKCTHCGYLQVVPASAQERHCVKCGEQVGRQKTEV